MKKIIIILLSFTISTAAFAQHKDGGRSFHGGGRLHGGNVTHVYIAGGFSPYLGLGYGFGYPYFGNPYFNYPYGEYPAFGYGRPSKLTLQVQDIKSDYKDKIWSARHDKSLSSLQRRETIRNLKNERDKAINNLEMNYYRR